MIKENTLINGNCQEYWEQIKRDLNVALILTDPPYNINFKYDSYEDQIPDDKYIHLFGTFKDEIMAICHYPEEMMKYVVPALGIPIEVLAWCYNSNIGKQFRLFNIYGKKPDFSKVKQPYKNPTDKRVKKLIDNGSEGTSLYDWFSDIQIVKNVSKKDNSHPCPVPVSLMERLILLLTDEGDLVYDPFMGSGTTALACQKTNRKFIGTEIDEKYYEESLNRVFT
ncbi:MAG TPA: site-specific DNA-methyltransferase [Candidatus Paceibacterota bacterium]|nr:site-specific DNA-methyltransferase [Candidatus Paceibacterota bacterium]